MRATMSVLPAGVNGTTMVTERVGWWSARAGGAAERPAIAAPASHRKLRRGSVMAGPPSAMLAMRPAGSRRPELGADRTGERRDFRVLCACRRHFHRPLL